LDDQHKRLVGLTNQLHNLLETNKNIQIKKTFKKIVDDLEIHFETEEKLMKESKLPLFFSHTLEHERFHNKLNTLYLEVKSGEKKLTLDDLKVIKIWFFNHIDFKDKALADHINAYS
jgi:hemerythrin